MFAKFLLIVTAFTGTTGELDSLAISIEATPRKIAVADVVFVRVTIRNVGEDAILLPSQFLPDLGLCRFELADTKERTRFACLPYGMGGGAVPKITLDPGQAVVVLYDALPMPRLDWIDGAFWNLNSWRTDTYELGAYLRMGKQVYCKVFGPKIHIDRRPQKEMRVLLDFYDGGDDAPVPRDWDWDRPSLGIFGLLFPLVGSIPAELDRIEQKLSPGNLREIVHATRLTTRVYDAKTLEEKRRAADALFKWLDTQHEIARHWMAMQLVSWSSGNKGLGEYCFEFVDGLIPMLPEEYGGQSLQQNYRKENEYSRQHYLDYMKARKWPSEPIQPEENKGVHYGKGDRSVCVESASVVLRGLSDSRVFCVEPTLCWLTATRRWLEGADATGEPWAACGCSGIGGELGGTARTGFRQASFMCETD